MMNLQKFIDHIGQYVLNNKTNDCPRKISIKPIQTGLTIEWECTDADYLNLAHMASETTLRRIPAIVKVWDEIIKNLDIEEYEFEIFYKDDTDEDPSIVRSVNRKFDSKTYPDLDLEMIADEIFKDIDDILEVRLYKIIELPNGRRIMELVDVRTNTDQYINDSVNDGNICEPVEESKGPVHVKDLPKYSITKINNKEITSFLREQKQKCLNSKGEVFCIAHSYNNEGPILFYREGCTAKRLAELFNDPMGCKAETVYARIGDVVYTMWKDESIPGYKCFTTSVDNYKSITCNVSAKEAIEQITIPASSWNRIKILHHEPCGSDEKDPNFNFQVIKSVDGEYIFSRDSEPKTLTKFIEDHVFYQVTAIEIYDSNDNITELYLPGTAQDQGFDPNVWTHYNLR